MSKIAFKSPNLSHIIFYTTTSFPRISVAFTNQISTLQCQTMLQTLTNSKSLKPGEILHAHMLTSGILHKNTNLTTKLAAFYANCGKMAKSQIIFDQILTKSSFLWNFMIRGYTNSGFYLKSLLFYREMISLGFYPDNFTYPFVIKACGDSLMVEFGRIIHGEVVISGFEPDVYVSNCLIAMYSKFGEMGSARLVFDRMPKRDLTSWNTMVNGYAKNGCCNEALSLFHLLMRFGLVPDSTTLLGLLSSCSDLQMVEKGKEVHGFVLRNSLFSFNRFLINSIVELYCKCKMMVYARRLFAVSSKDSVTWNTMISGYVQIGKAFDGLKLFCQMVSYGERPDLATIIALLRACEQVTAIDFGMSMHSYLVQKGFGSSTMAATALIGMYAQCGRLSCSQHVFGEIAEKTLVTWTAMISSYGHHGKGKEAISFFNQMVENGIVPDEGAFTCVLTACSHAGLLVDGREIFHQIKKYSMKPALAHYACLVDLLSRAGHLEEAYEIINNMAVEPTDDVWVSLLSGCKLHGNVSLAEVCAQKVSEENPDRVSGHISLSHIYADEKRWDDVQKLRSKLQSKGLAMPRGYSFIE